MKKYYEIENYDEEFKTEEEAKRRLEKILYDESMYNYKINRNNSYSLLEVIYDEEKDDYIYTEILRPITIEEFKAMEYEEKEKYFKREN